jgi:transcriptional repressor NrdR
MRCPFCEAMDSRVVDTRPVDAGIRRRRECSICQRRFTTYEQVTGITPLVVKSDGRREEFDRQKLLSGVRKACAKRPIPGEDIEDLVTHIEDDLLGSGRTEISSKEIGEMTLERLRDLDEVAYIRFASVYLAFKDLDSMKKEVEKLLERR